MIKYSIIIPTLNEEKLLPKLLDILNDEKLRQVYDFEIIISDGGSTDKTIEIAKSKVDKIITKPKNEKQNIGIGRNIGAEHAKGEILIFFNGDIYPKSIFDIFDTINKKFIPGKCLAMTCCVEVFPDEQIFVDKIFHTFYNYYFHFLNIIGLGMGRGECHIVKKEVFEKMKGYNETFAAGEDFDLFRRIRKNGKILFARNLVVYESPRRYRKDGHFKILLTWLINSVYIMFTKSAKSKEWEQIR
ncbi:MAG: glycosyltransferase [Ignavibacteriae bacterium]|nr:glycosyltransferase [Ignavibacteriota bacterium]